MTTPQIVEGKYPSGQRYWKIDTCLDGKRKRLFFNSQIEAKNHLEKLRRDGLEAANIPRSLAFEAIDARKKLEPFGWTISKAVDYLIEKVLKHEAKRTLSVLVDQWLGESERVGSSLESRADLRYRMKKLTGALDKETGKPLGGFRLHEMTPEHIKDVDKSMQEVDHLSPVSRNQFLTRWSSFFGWAIANRLTDYNPCDPKAVRRAKVSRGKTVFYSLEECRTILDIAQQSGFYHYCVLGLFCGIRPAELRRLQLQHIKMGQRLIRLEGEEVVGKSKARTRIIEFPAGDAFGDCLFDWLSARPLPEKVWKTNRANFKIHFRKFRKALAERGVVWHQDAMRHTAATYCFHFYDSAEKAIKMLGHNGSVAVFYNHYKGLASKADATEFYSLRPKQANG